MSPAASPVTHCPRSTHPCQEACRGPLHRKSVPNSAVFKTQRQRTGKRGLALPGASKACLGGLRRVCAVQQGARSLASTSLASAAQPQASPPWVEFCNTQHKLQVHAAELRSSKCIKVIRQSDPVTRRPQGQARGRRSLQGAAPAVAGLALGVQHGVGHANRKVEGADEGVLGGGRGVWRGRGVGDGNPLKRVAWGAARGAARVGGVEAGTAPQSLIHSVHIRNAHAGNAHKRHAAHKPTHMWPARLLKPARAPPPRPPTWQPSTSTTSSMPTSPRPRHSASGSDTIQRCRATRQRATSARAATRKRMSASTCGVSFGGACPKARAWDDHAALAGLGGNIGGTGAHALHAVKSGVKRVTERSQRGLHAGSFLRRPQNGVRWVTSRGLAWSQCHFAQPGAAAVCPPVKAHKTALANAGPLHPTRCCSSEDVSGEGHLTCASTAGASSCRAASMGLRMGGPLGGAGHGGRRAWAGD